MIVKINDKEITLRKSFRSLIMYEKATGASFSLKTVSDMIMYFYCVVAASNDVDIDFDAFLNWLDDNEAALVEFTKWLTEQNKVDEFTATKKKVRKRETK